MKLLPALIRLTTRVRLAGSQDCFVCGMATHDGLVCAGCLHDLPAIPLKHCPVCALSTPQGETCGACLRHRPHFDATLAAFEYAFPMEKMVIALKYHSQLPLAHFFAQMMSTVIEAPAADCIIPMPLHPQRLIERGFNQSAEIARRLGRHWQLPVVLDACVRDRNTPPQAPLNSQERRKNVKSAFRCTTDLGGRHVLVVDDVMTTGSTLDEVARVLKSRGAARVTNCVLTRTLPSLGSDHV